MRVAWYMYVWGGWGQETEVGPYRWHTNTHTHEKSECWSVKSFLVEKKTCHGENRWTAGKQG